MEQREDKYYVSATRHRKVSAHRPPARRAAPRPSQRNVIDRMGTKHRGDRLQVCITYVAGARAMFDHVRCRR